MKQNGLRDKGKVLIGVTTVSDDYTREIGANTYSIDDPHSIKILQSFQELKVYL